MKASDYGRYTLGVCAAAMLAGCGGGSGTLLSPPPAGVTPAHVRPAYSVLYSFKGGSRDGVEPAAGLLNVKGMLYGTTYEGGASFAFGTVFAITTSGKESLLHSFGGSGDGSWPYAGLINVNGTLYGTTYYGGVHTCSGEGCGTVFAIATSGKETVLHSFKGGKRDGAEPFAGLINVNGTLYGTTGGGGAKCSASGGCGTVFAITTSGKETALHSFGSSGDGNSPEAGLLNVNGDLYGTTEFGGANGKGTVFAITTSGKETVLYSFGSGSGDGEYPRAGLINVRGTLYGTTSRGGSGSCGSRIFHGCGTVFAMTTSGKETVLHSFKGKGHRDGNGPVAGLLNVNGTLYGTTAGGGANGEGTIFLITTSGKETVLYSFGAGSRDGEHPKAGLINVNGTLYGTTEVGGASSYGGYGTVFSLSP
ncbi:MAG: choice-of-anchor tandem repeat GloVer-containing protein [Candidatus Cybelea sp.]